MNEEGTQGLRRREFLAWLCKIGGGATALTLGPGILPLRRVNTVLFGSTAHAQGPCTEDVCTTRDICETQDAGHTCEVRDVCNVDESDDCTNDECSVDKSGQCQGDQCGADASGACETDSCTGDISGGCQGDTCRSDKSAGCQNDTCVGDSSGACVGDSCPSDKSGACTSDRCTSDKSQGCMGDVCRSDSSGACQSDRCPSDSSGACKSDVCQGDASGMCQNDDCDEDKSAACLADGCASDKSGACASDTCTVYDASGACESDTCTVSDTSQACELDTCNEDSSGECHNDTCNEDNSTQCINDTCDIDNRICESDATCALDGVCFMDGVCLEDLCLDDGVCFLDGLLSRRKPQTGGTSLVNAAVKWLYKLVALLLFLPFLTLPRGAEAAVYNIPAGDVAGLIAAMEAANVNPDADTINLAAGDYVLTAPYQEKDYWIAGLPSVISPITINGSEAGTTTVRRSATAEEDFCVLHVTETDVQVSEAAWEERAGDLTLNRLVIRGGRFSVGAGVFNQGATLSIAYCTFKENAAVEDDVINIYSAGGGAIGNLGGALTVANSTISGNTANGYGYEPAAGGGIENIGGQVIIRNSTIQGNSVQSEEDVAAGGGMSGPAQEILNVTIAGNQVVSTGIEEEAVAIGGGLFFPGGLKNSIVTNNTADVGSDVFSTTSQGYNIIKAVAADAFFSTGTSDLVNTDPGLADYTDSGAPGRGYLPVEAGSPAIDSADPTSCTPQDQLGYPRINTCERGAVEYRAGPHISITPKSLPFGNVTQGTSSDRNATVENIGTENLIIGAVAQANPLSAPFSMLTDNCSGATLAAGETCTLTVQFAPTAAGAFSDSFDIPSNDPDANPVTVAVTGTGTVSAYTLNASANPVAGGTVTKNPNQASYAPGTDVQLTATANPGYGFTGWSGDLSGTANPATITMDGNKTVTADFAASQALATGKASSFTATVSNIEMFNGSAWVSLFAGSAQLDLVAGGTFPGIEDLNLPEGTYTKLRVTFRNAFSTTGNLRYDGTRYYTTAATFGGQTNLASKPTTVQGSMAAYTFRMAAWGALNANVVKAFNITPITVTNETDYQPTLRFTLSNRLQLMGVSGSPGTYYFEHVEPGVSVVE